MKTKIIKLVEDVIKSKITHNAFIEKLFVTFSKEYNVPNCNVKIFNSNDELTGGRQNPAFFSRKHETIYFREDVIKEFNISRIIKLTAHEWMHYYVSLVEKGVIENNIIPTYKDLVLEASKDIMPKIHVEIMKFLKAFQKLSAEELVADNFAQDLLKNIYNEIKDNNLKESIKYQIDSHNQQIDNMNEIINKYPELDKFTKEMKKKLDKEG